MAIYFSDFYKCLENGERFTLYNGESTYTMAKPLTPYLLCKYKRYSVSYYEQIQPTSKNQYSKHYIEIKE